MASCLCYRTPKASPDKGRCSMSSILPFASGPHPVWSPVANEIHAAIWDRVGLGKVQGFVREWASDWAARFKAAEPAQQETFARVRQSFHYPEDWTLNLIADNLPYDRQLKQARDAIWTWQPELPTLPLPPSHSPRSLAEKWAALAAVHDVFNRTGDKVLPWPLPEDDQDLAAFTEWMRGEGGAYQALLRAASELRDAEADPVRRWLEDAKKATAPEVEHSDAAGDTEVVKRLALLLGPEEARIADVAANKTKTVEQRMMEIVAIDKRFTAKDSEEWAVLLGCSSAAIRKLDFWDLIRKSPEKAFQRASSMCHPV